ncbi:M28 family metallopeptidase [Flavobacterium sp. I3-2]|uniref:M28 family metallopeptidase n=1 Tax=Flavobacterium sp. I3-2 TaxID=2748319 RepID=UPI0015AB961C|nr:M28 family metallopeptidase [Flavobacterium sp. I3-2]
MRKYVISLCLTAFLTFTINAQSNKETEQLEFYLNSVSKQNLINNLGVLAADEMEGRKTGEFGQKMAANFIRDYYKDLKIAAAPGTEDYFQMVPSKNMRRMFSPKLNDSENVVAYIEGSEFPDEYIVISAHYDHVGMANGEIFNGADDDASGTSAVMEIARLFQKAKLAGNGPKRSIVFLHCTGEEYGLFGSNYYVNNPLFPLKNTVCNLNIDMIGRTDQKHAKSKDYLYLIGSDKLSQELHDLSESTNKKYTKLILDYEFNEVNHPEQMYFRSDHYNFAKRNIPVIFYYSGTHVDYHQPTDTFDKIEFDKMHQRIKLIFATAWEVANQPNRIKLNQ